MGQEASTLIDQSTSPQTLSARTVDAVASYIKEGRARKIVVMASQMLARCWINLQIELTLLKTGAGISTAAGIPDFRSPKTGIYANLAKLDLPYPEAVFDISYFRSNPLPFYTLAHQLDPTKYKPTLSHCFVRLLSDKGLLLKLFTQNIDCLERAAGVPDDKIVEAHGSFASQRCIDCQSAFPDDLMKQAISRCEVPHCTEASCNGLVKPDIVFFGEALPGAFHRNRTLPAAADLAIVMGTSLKVQPFASLPGFCSEGIPRLLVNSERAGGLGSRADDVLFLGDCDEGVRKLASAVGWVEELEAVFNAHHPDQPPKAQSDASKSQDERLDDGIAKITRDVDDALRISSQHTADLQTSLSLSDLTASKVSSFYDEEHVQSQLGADTDVPPTVDHDRSAQSSQGKKKNESPVKEEEFEEQSAEFPVPHSQTQALDLDGPKSSF